MLYTEIIAVCSEIHTEHIHCGAVRRIFERWNWWYIEHNFKRSNLRRRLKGTKNQRRHNKIQRQAQIILTRSTPLCVIAISTKEYSLAFKLTNQATCFSYTANIKPIYNHLLSYKRGVSKTLGEWYQKTNKTQDINKLTLLGF
jgi:hypothetical protein